MKKIIAFVVNGKEYQVDADDIIELETEDGDRYSQAITQDKKHFTLFYRKSDRRWEIIESNN